MADMPANNPEPTPAPVKEPPVAAAPTPTPSPAPAPSPTPAPAADKTPWPENWRDQVLGELPTDANDKQKESYAKEKSRLERMSSPQDVWKSFRSAEAKISSGELKATTAFPDKGTDAEKAAWREQNGVPPAPADYLKSLALPKGVEITETDKPGVEKYLATMHAAHASPAAASAGLNAYYQLKADGELALRQADETHKAEAEDTLRAEWPGPDYRTNQGYVENFIAAFPPDVQEGMKNARMPDGRALFNNADVLKTMARLQREINPISTVLPNGANGPKAMDARIAEIEGIMRTDRQRYNKDQGMQSELRELYGARDKAKARAA